MAINPKNQLAKTPLTVNEQFFDALVRHQIHLLRMSGSIKNDVIELLNANEAELAEKIRSRLLKIKPGGLVPANAKKLERLVKEIKLLRRKTWSKVTDKWFEEFRELVQDEQIFLANVTTSVAPIIVTTSQPAVSTLQTLVTHQPFEGKTLRGWARALERADVERITDTIRNGIVQGENSQQIARRVVGTARLKGTDGVTQITRRNAEAITRTAVNSFGNQAKREFYKENSDLFDQEQYVATLDARTTPICRSLDGKLFDIGRGPIPPRHIGCRSLRVAYFGEESFEGIERGFVSSTNKQLLRKFTKQQSISNVSSRAKLPRGFKGKFDKFARKEVRRLTGRVPAKVNYQQWLSRQSSEFQDDVLGVTKARLFRKGGLSLDRFVNQAGDELTLKQIAIKDKQAFINAGLDPSKFK